MKSVCEAIQKRPNFLTKGKEKEELRAKSIEKEFSGYMTGNIVESDTAFLSALDKTILQPCKNRNFKPLKNAENLSLGEIIDVEFTFIK